MNIKKIYSRAVKEYETKNYGAALKILEEVHLLDPRHKQAYYLEGAVWKEMGNIIKEYYALKKILPLLKFSSPKEKDFAAESLCHFGEICTDLHLSEEAKKAYSLMIKLGNPLKINRLTNAIFHGNSFEDVPYDYFRTLYAEYRKSLANVKPYPKKFYDHKKIRVGFMSTDFREHPVINWSWSLLTKLDRNLFKVYCYSNVKYPDKVTEHLRSIIDGWRNICDLTDKEVAKLIRNDEIDILFDLNGHTEDYNRLRAAAYHPASVQMSGIGYMGSTGLDCFDYFLSDETCAGDENYFTEKLIKLPHSHICYEPPTEFPPVDFPPCIKNKFVTFGSFNQFNKVTDSILKTWKKILDAVPNSKLILKNKILNTEDGKNFVQERLKNFDFDLERVELRPSSSTWLAEYGDVDIALDTFPYTGGITTCEALYMGVPVISLYGDRHGSRFGLSILKNVGLDELAVPTYDEYVRRAIMLANDWELLMILRKNLRTMMKKSPLMDSKNYLREIQNAFIKILNDERQKS